MVLFDVVVVLVVGVGNGDGGRDWAGLVRVVEKAIWLIITTRGKEKKKKKKKKKERRVGFPWWGESSTRR